LKFLTDLFLLLLHILDIAQNCLSFGLLVFDFIAYFLKHLLKLLNFTLQDLASICLGLQLLLSNLDLFICFLGFLLPQRLGTIELLNSLVSLFFEVIKLGPFVLISVLLILCLPLKHLQ